MKYLTLFRMRIFGAAHVWEAKTPLSLESVTHSTLMKLGTVIPYQKIMKKHINHVTNL